MHPCYTKAAIILLATTTFSFFTAAAQEKNPLINSGELVKKGQQLHDDKKYKEAIDEYNKIDKSDTNYVIALQELSYSFYADSQLDRSLQTAKLGMELFPNKYVPFSLQAANTLDDMDKSTEAISLYDSALVRSPQSFLLYFNKGVVNYKLKNYTECKKNFQQCILMNPYYTSAHYFLGKAYMLEGNLVPAMLAFNTYLLMAPGGKYFSNVITALSDISKVSDDILEYTKNKSNSKEDDFSMQQDILLSKLAFDKKYKLKADLEDNIVRQIQVVNEKLEYNKSDKGFCMQYYVPFFIQTMNDDNFEAMVFTAFSGVTNNKIESWQKKNKKEKQAFIDKASAYFDAIKRTRILDPQTRNESSYSYIYSNNTLIGHGLSTKDKDPVPTGKWEYYHDNGAVKAVGSFDNTGEKDGLWTYYHDNGQVKEKSTMVHGKLNGTADAWFDNGNKWYTDTYVDGKLNGIQAINFYNGNPKSITSYKDDMKNGEEKFYDYKGFLTSSDTYVDDKLEGWSRAYYPDGKVKSEVMFKKDKEDGTYKSFFNSGKLYIQGEFTDGMRQGLWTTYFEDGVVSEKTVYVDNDITGEFTEYYSSGKLSRKGTYYKKKMDGKLENFDEDGKVFGELIYDRGKLKEVNFYDKAGNVISNTTTRKGAATITFYSAEGIKTSEGYFNRDGYKDGKFTEYYNSGSVSEESNWKAGVKDGPQINYYPDGKISKKTNFKDGEEDGYVTDYYANGKISSEGWRVEGKRQQHYLYYNNVGDLTTDEYFQNEELNGYSEYYEPGNIHSIQYKYKTGWLLGIKQFDSTGKVISNNVFQNGKGPIIYKYPGGQNSSVGSYDHYMLNGAYNYYFFDGSPSATSFYKNDQRDSTYKSYYYNGKVKTEGKFKAGEKVGKWKYYYSNGKMSEEENYVDGELEGINKLYQPDGSLDKMLTYKNGELDGPYELYGDKNQLAARFNYSRDILKSYQYETKPGELCAPIPLKGSTGLVKAKYANGKESLSINFSNNSNEGERKIYFSDGKIYVDVHRINGYNDGLCKTYYPNGQVWEEENYVLGMLHGSCKYYYPNGKLEKEEFYYNNDNHGVNKYYDETGKLKQTRIYYYGTLLSAK